MAARKGKHKAAGAAKFRPPDLAGLFRAIDEIRMSRKNRCMGGERLVREGMPQMQLPMFPAGVTEINSRIAVEARDGRVCYVYGHLPVFQHEETDVRSFRMFTSQMIATGSVKPREIVETFGVPMVTVKRYMKVYRQQGAKGFYESKARHSSASKLKDEALERAQQLLDQGRSVPEVAEEINVLANTIHKAIRAGRLRRPSSQKKANRQP